MKWACVAACTVAYGLVGMGWAEDTQSGRDGESKRAWLLEKFDANGDGKLDGKERHAARKAKILKKFDADGDGSLNETERNAAKNAYRDRQEDRRDRGEDVRDRREDVRDRAEDVRDRREDRIDAQHDGGKWDKIEDRSFYLSEYDSLLQASFD